jgi:hypothetical protein
MLAPLYPVNRSLGKGQSTRLESGGCEEPVQTDASVQEIPALGAVLTK